MTNENLAIAPIAAARPARVHLDETMARVGVDGLAAAFAEPALLARVDQHAATVRDSIRDAGRVVDAESLASYARSITAGAARMGRSVPEPGQAPTGAAAWMNAAWPLLPLVAVCLLALEADLH
ncbi:DUF6401 family natural product biosynthesis protein [Actinoplanes sp. DH11]|uniref:DUF6401 family natural product biosynthesis protein n=1 Tax=Actinoplanes sp. DH11 TaxID=2857011 RepID=UPI001E4CA78E|nr:DUF6401 family natural product biosynthesis protein [Actinoplanes sp. DH11]